MPDMDILLSLPFFVACLAAGATGVLFPPGAWYQALRKPGFTPSNRAFPIVWTLLYLAMTVAGARLVQRPDAGLALSLWAAQITLNTLWTPVFFGAHRARLGQLVIGALWAVLALSIPVFWQVDPVAGLLFVPYLLWVSVAFALNRAIVRLNPELR